MDRTRWWYVLVGAAVVNVLWGLATEFSDVTTASGPSMRWIILGGTILLLVPVFYYSLYRALRSVRDSGSSWEPDLRLWVGGGVVVSLVGCFAFLNPMIHYVAGLYLIQRFRKPVLSSPAAGLDR